MLKSLREINMERWFKMKFYCYIIQDGENTYEEYSLNHYMADEVADGFMRACKDIVTYEATKEEIKVLQKFGVL